MRVWVRVYDGQALVKDADKEVKVKGGRELDFAANGPLKAQKFDKKRLRIAICIAGAVAIWLCGRSERGCGWDLRVERMGSWGPGWWGAGWYWTRGSTDSRLFQETGIFYSSFGWGFYSPWYVYGAPFYGYGYGRYGYGGHTLSITSARTCTTGARNPLRSRPELFRASTADRDRGTRFQSGPGTTADREAFGGSRWSGSEGGGFHGLGIGGGASTVVVAALMSLTQSGMTVRFAGFVDLTTVLRLAEDWFKTTD